MRSYFGDTTLVICAIGAHVESRKSAVRGLLAAARFPSPLIKPDVPN